MSADGGIREYRIYRGGAQIGTSVITTFADNGLTAATSYEYQVSAVSANGDIESVLSAPVTATTAAA